MMDVSTSWQFRGMGATIGEERNRIQERQKMIGSWRECFICFVSVLCLEHKTKATENNFGGKFLFLYLFLSVPFVSISTFSFVTSGNLSSRPPQEVFPPPPFFSLSFRVLLPLQIGFPSTYHYIFPSGTTCLYRLSLSQFHTRSYTDTIVL